VRFTVDCSVFHAALDEMALAWTTGIDDVEQRFWHTGLVAGETPVTLTITWRAVDIDNGRLDNFQVVVPHARIVRYSVLQGGATRKAVPTQQVVLEAMRASVTVDGEPLIPADDSHTGEVPAGGVFWYHGDT
jgi:hypothetical protein